MYIHVCIHAYGIMILSLVQTTHRLTKLVCCCLWTTSSTERACLSEIFQCLELMYKYMKTCMCACICNTQMYMYCKTTMINFIENCSYGIGIGDH